jgi:hypothetical protein
MTGKKPKARKGDDYHAPDGQIGMNIFVVVCHPEVFGDPDAHVLPSLSDARARWQA